MTDPNHGCELCPAPLARVLIVAGSDSGGGAGAQADIKTVTALGGYAMTAITALTAQNTCGVFGVFPVDPDFVRQQMHIVLTDLGTDAVKIGMLHSAEIIETVVDTLQRHARGVPVIVDPVMVAKGGAPLLEPAAVEALVRRLLPCAALLTPNSIEASVLVGRAVRTEADFGFAADRLLAMGAGAVLLKGGHLESESVVEVLRTADGDEYRFESARFDTRSTHGTGCTLASAIAVGVAQGWTLRDSVARARCYVAEAIRTAPGFGRGHGPLNHTHPLTKP